MPLRLSEIEGINYFLIADKTANETLKNISLRLEIGKETEEFLKEAKENLCDCIGYKQAEKIGSYGELRKAVKEDIKRRRPYDEFAEEFWERANIVAKGGSKIDPHEEIVRDAIYHTLRRTGFVKVYNIITDSDIDELDIANDVLSGQDFYNLVPLPKNTIELLNRAMVSYLEREQFMDSLKQKGLSKEQLEQIDNTLYKSDSFDKAYEEIRKIADVSRDKIHAFITDKRNFTIRFKEFVKDIGYDLNSQQIYQLRDGLKKLHRGLGITQPFRLERALIDLYSGVEKIEYVLLGNYRKTSIYHLADFVKNLDLRTCGVENFHTRIASLASNIDDKYRKGEYSVPGKILKLLSKLTDLDPYRWASKFNIPASGIQILYPNPEIPDNVLGELYGEMLSRGYKSFADKDSEGHVWRYTLRKPKEQIIELFEKIGSLNKEPNEWVLTVDAEDLIKSFGNVTKQPYYISREMTIPKQIANIYESINPEKFGKRFAKSALKNYLENKGKRTKYQRIYIYIPLEKENMVRSLANKVGLNLSEGSLWGNQKNCHISNPWVVGL